MHRLQQGMSALLTEEARSVSPFVSSQVTQITGACTHHVGSVKSAGSWWGLEVTGRRCCAVESCTMGMLCAGMPMALSFQPLENLLQVALLSTSAAALNTTQFQSQYNILMYPSGAYVA